jgi:hypothetical protein
MGAAAVAEFKAVWDNIDRETRQVRYFYLKLILISFFNHYLAVRRPEQIWSKSKKAGK